MHSRKAALRGSSTCRSQARPAGKRGPKPKPVVEFPQPLTTDWVDPQSFSAALALHAGRHGDSYHHLRQAIVRDGETFDRKTVQTWATGSKIPQSALSFSMLERIEHRYRLPAGYFKAKLPQSGKALLGHDLPGIAATERRRLAWHLPDDFDQRTLRERTEILEWVRTVIISGSTEYRRYQVEAMKSRYALGFPPLDQIVTLSPDRLRSKPGASSHASKELVEEIAALIRFKTRTLTAIGEQRSGVWGDETASQKLEHLALMFGALSSPPESAIAGLGVPVGHLSLAMLVFPAVWDWYLRWRETRRGFYTAWEINMLGLALAFTRRETGWMWQNEELAERLVPIPSLVTEAEVDDARRDWKAACERMHAHGLARSKEVARVARVHRDPFEPILSVLESDSPVGEYRRITTAILDECRTPRATPKQRQRS